MSSLFWFLTWFGIWLFVGFIYNRFIENKSNESYQECPYE